MAFAYIDPSQAILEMTLEAMGGLAPLPIRSKAPEVPTISCELDESWKDFEKELGNFKRKFAKEKRDLGIKLSELEELQKSTQISKLIIDTVPSEDLKAKLVSVVDNYESESGIVALTQQCGELKGKVEAMENVLRDTEAERYAKFLCFICQDRLIDLFIDPCGHTVCATCWTSTRVKRTCPGCRTDIQGVKKIYSM
jgi:Zinc finger, C3HC4 type (RING finger)